MSKRNKGARARARKARLAALRAEIVLLLEDKVLPYHMQLNIQTTQKLVDHVQKFGVAPLWAQRIYTKKRAWEQGVWHDELIPLPQQVFDDTADAFARAFDAAVLTGTGIVRLTPDQQSGTIMDMDSGNASGHDT